MEILIYHFVVGQLSESRNYNDQDSDRCVLFHSVSVFLSRITQNTHLSSLCDSRITHNKHLISLCDCILSKSYPQHKYQFFMWLYLYPELPTTQILVLCVTVSLSKIIYNTHLSSLCLLYLNLESVTHNTHLSSLCDYLYPELPTTRSLSL